jgi:monoamine oxidase
MSRCDVVVVGAGLSGLSTLQRLTRMGVDGVVLEARDRVGGRTLSREHLGARFEHGAQWLGAGQDRVIALADELGLTRFAQHHTGTKILDAGRGLRRYRGRIPSLSLLGLLQTELGLRRFDAMARTVPLGDPYEAAEARRWDAMSVAQARDRFFGNKDARAMFDVAIRTVLGAEPEEVSLLHFLFYVNSAGGIERLIDIPEGAQKFRLVEGTQAIAQGLARELGDRVVLASPVHAIAHGPDGVVVHAERQSYSARYVVMALPPHLCARVRFDPPLDPLRDALLSRFTMGATTKVIGFYREATWRARGLSGEAIVLGGPLSCVFDNTSHDGRVAALVGFVVGRHARRWSRMPLEERRKAALAELERLFDVPAASAIDYAEHDWSAEPWTGGCPVASLPVGALASFAEVFRKPEGRIHFAGTETATHWNGYLEGALSSAERAGAEVLTRLTRSGRRVEGGRLREHVADATSPEIDRTD